MATEIKRLKIVQPLKNFQIATISLHCTTMKAFHLLTLALCNSAAIASPTVIDAELGVTYKGLNRNGIEIFLNIPYAEDTGGANRFKPPIPYVPGPGTIISGQSYGPACPQALGPWFLPISISNVTEVSEDCLNLNVARPKGVCAGAKLPVMVWIHGGSFWTGQNGEITTAPDGMILESVRNGLPIIHVAMNYRLGCKSSQAAGLADVIADSEPSLRFCSVQRP